jgi:hypothetical protein
MDCYALLDENNIVVNVITGKKHNEITDEIPNWEEYYAKFHNLHCKRTCQNTQAGVFIDEITKEESVEKAFRKNYAGVGFSYDEELDAFIPPQPYQSWTLDEETCNWNPPVLYPIDDKFYEWNESTQEWDRIE